MTLVEKADFSANHLCCHITDQDANVREPCFRHASPSTWNALKKILKCNTRSLSAFRRRL